MIPVAMLGVSSVLDRTLFTKHGPIIKGPTPILTGSDLIILSTTQIKIASANFNSSDIGRSVSISGSSGGRNDGTFEISQVLNSKTLVLDKANFSTIDETAVLNQVMALANMLKMMFNLHLVHTDSRVATSFIHPTLSIHVVDDIYNTVSLPDATDLNSSIVLLNAIKTSYMNHINNNYSVLYNYNFHIYVDTWNVITYKNVSSLYDCLFLANELRKNYEAHRLELRSHYIGDVDDQILASKIKKVYQTVPGDLVGPFNWIEYNQNLGVLADSPSDVTVTINGISVTPQAVIGILGAVVLPTKPLVTDVVLINYDWIRNPPSKFEGLNNFGYVLNQDKNHNIMGIPGHEHRARSHLIDTSSISPDLSSPNYPIKIGWKYKGYEREYTAALNDPNTLLLNSPTNEVKYPVLRKSIKEVTINYDPNTLPQNAKDPWKLEGDGTFTLAPDFSELTIIDNDYQLTVGDKPPFFTHNCDIITQSYVSAAFRARIENYSPDGVFTGVGFGISDGYKIALVGFIQSDAQNLSSAIALVNYFKTNFNLHTVQPTVHNPNDISDQEIYVNATDLTSLIILVNDLKIKYNTHILKSDPTGVTDDVHAEPDVTNTVISSDAADLDSTIILINELKTKFNLHLTQDTIHFTNDTWNTIGYIKQVGILTNANIQESGSGWVTSAVDWTITTTYRIVRDVSGSVPVYNVYLSGGTSPIISVSHTSLPAISDLEGKFDPVQQIFFGSISRAATSTSGWTLIRSNINPVDSNLVEDNKSVVYDCIHLPEFDPNFPWITLGHGGFETLTTHGKLLIDSACSATQQELSSIGKSSGLFRGFSRLEPILSNSTVCVIDFETSINYYTFSVGEKSCGVYLDDGQQAVHFSFIYYNPSPAVIIGSASVFNVLVNDYLIIRFNTDNQLVIAFPMPPHGLTWEINDIVNWVNTSAGFNLASNVGGCLQLSYGSGSSSYLEISSSTINLHAGKNAYATLGLPLIKVFGKDSNPEPIVSWCSDNPPDQEQIPWSAVGGLSYQMVETPIAPAMRINDDAVGDYLSFIMPNSVITAEVINTNYDWKVDCRLLVNDFTAGNIITATAPFVSLYFAGVLVNIDESPSGKNIELQYAVDINNVPYINILSYQQSTNLLIIVAQYMFNWNDGKQHDINIFTNKGSDTIFICADGEILTPIVGTSNTSYTGLQQGSNSTPSILFGSGSEAVNNTDPSTAMSLVDWYSIAIFKDSKLSNPTASANRYIGIYAGGDPTLLDSYYRCAFDWMVTHQYRIVRDPSNFISVYVDGGNIPVISIKYDPILLPPSMCSFLSKISNGNSSVTFGTFDSKEISRSRWSYVNYSIGKLTITDRLVPPHQILNQANVVASPEHLYTQTVHQHGGFRVYSGGTPTDDFYGDMSIEAFTVLGERTPPIPMTQNLESAGGLLKVVTPISSMSTSDFIDYKGFLSYYEDDNENIIVAPIATEINSSIALASDIRNKLNRHVNRLESHVYQDPNDLVFLNAVDLSSVVALANTLKYVFNNHRTRLYQIYTVHVTNDTINVVTSPDATDQTSVNLLLNEISSKYTLHLVQTGVHSSSVLIRLQPPPRVLYEGMQFWITDNGGAPDLVHPFSDDIVYFYMGP